MSDGPSRLPHALQSGLGSFAYTWNVGVDGATPAEPLGPSDLVDEAAALGMDAVQLGDNVPLSALDHDGLIGLRERASRAGVSLELGARGLTPAALREQLGIARTLDARLLRYVTDMPGHEPSADAVIALLRDARDELRRAGVAVAIENHDRFRAAELARIVREVDNPLVGVCLDTVNSFGSGEGLGEVLRELAPLTLNLHVKDFTIRRRRHGMGFVVRGAPLGQGMLDLDAVLDAVERHGRCPTAVFEQWAPACSTLAETTALERAWAKAGTTVLRQALEARRRPPQDQGAHPTP